MRITQSIITRNLLSYLNDTKESMSANQSAIASGKGLTTSSDDPVKFSMVTRFKEAQNRNEQYLKNILDAQSWIESSTTVIEDLYDYNLSAKDIARQAADSSQNEDTRTILAKQLDSMIEEMVGLANTKYLGKYVFAGTQTQEEVPFTYDGEAVSYNGNSDYIKRRVTENFDVSINIPGSEILNTGLFENLITLRDALSNNDQQAISQSIDELEKSADNLMTIDSKLGSLKNQFNLTQNRLEASNTNLNSFISDLEDVDLTKAITQYNTDEIVYQAALQTISDTLNLSLLNFLE
jgi:flagellar hook-associated protein 3 FlgL